MADRPLDTSDVLAVDEAVARSSGAAGYGITDGGFIPKPFARILAEKLALARALFGADMDLGSGSALRKILEVSALEDARTWAALTTFYDNQFVATARGEALSRLGEELALPRPFLEASGRVQLTAQLPTGLNVITLPRGARMLTPGFHHVALEETVTLSRTNPVRDVTVAAFYPGPEHNLDPAQLSQRITSWNADDPKLGDGEASLLFIARAQANGKGVPPEQIVAISHTQKLTGGDQMWPDARYRDLLLRAPRSIWTADAMRVALSLLPGMRQVQVRDQMGGLDIDLQLFGGFNFAQRLFGAERDLVSPYFFDVVVAPTEGALWDGPEGLAATIDAALEDLRPVGIFPRVRRADLLAVGVSAKLIVKGLPLPRGPSGDVNSSPAAIALKQRVLQRVARYVDGLGFGEPVRYAEVMWAMMNEPGITDVMDLHLLQYPPTFVTGAGGTLSSKPMANQPGENIGVNAMQIATFVDTDAQLQIG